MQGAARINLKIEFYKNDCRYFVGIGNLYLGWEVFWVSWLFIFVCWGNYDTIY